MSVTNVDKLRQVLFQIKEPLSESQGVNTCVWCGSKAWSGWYVNHESSCTWQDIKRVLWEIHDTYDPHPREPDQDFTGNCTCHITAPCGYCESLNECDTCSTITSGTRCLDCQAHKEG